MEDRLLLIVGCLNRETPYFQGARGKGIATFAFNEDAGEATALFEIDDIDNPTFFSADAAGRTLYVNSEVFGHKETGVAAYRIDRASGRLAYIGMQPSLGSISAYNTLSTDGRFLLLANYGIGTGGPDRSVVVFPLDIDGSLLPPVSSLRLTSSGPNLARQERSHAHCVRPLGATGLILVSDLGGDRLIACRLDAEGMLSIVGETRLLPGAGPRHIAISQSGTKVFVVNELDSTVQSFCCDGEGRLEPASRLRAVPEEISDNHCADLHLSPDERFLYASSRGHDSLAIFSVDPKTAMLEVRGYVPSLGATPRNFAITPSGRHVLVANQNSDQIVIFQRDGHTGMLEDTKQRIALGTPMCVRLLV